MATESGSVARMASQKESLLRQEFAEHVTVERPNRGFAGGHLPVFDAFNELGLTGRDIADIADVSPPMVSKWRQGKVCLPENRLAFLTLVLAHLLDDMETLGILEAEWGARDGGGDWCRVERARINAARAHLVLQEVLNRDLSVREVRNGARRFRDWWASGAATKLQQKRFRLAFNGSLTRDLEILTARVHRS